MSFLPSTVPTYFEVAEMRAKIKELTDERDALLAAFTEDEPVPFLPVDPEELRRMSTVASDGKQAMIYRQPVDPNKEHEAVPGGGNTVCKLCGRWESNGIHS